MDLVVNPLASIETVDGSDELITGGPIPGRGMQYLSITSAEQPRLHTLFHELGPVGLAGLDIHADLNEDDISVLREHGILVEADRVPERPLFSCMLDDAKPAANLPRTLIVNPTLDFQPFDLTKFPLWIRERNLSPHYATAWVVDTRTNVRWGYWLTPEQASIVGTLETGSVFTDDLDAPLTGKLYTAGILIDADTARGDAALDLAAEQFARDRYSVLHNIVPPAQLCALQAYYRKYVDQGFMKFGDRQVDRRFAAYREPVAMMFLDALKPVMTKLAGVNVIPTYAYSAVYAEGAELKPHIDRGPCQYSFSFQLEYTPEPENGISPWPLYLSVNEPSDLEVSPTQDRAIHLANGGLLAYMGRDIIHYRTPLFDGHRSASLFFHYVDASEGEV